MNDIEAETESDLKHYLYLPNTILSPCAKELVSHVLSFEYLKKCSTLIKLYIKDSKLLITYIKR